MWPAPTGMPRRHRLPADLVRLAGVVSVVVAVVARGPIDAALFLLVLGGLVLPPLFRAPVPLDAAYGVGLLVAAWSGSLDLYDVIGWLDLAIHFSATALVAAVAYLAVSTTGAAVPPHALGTDPVRAGERDRRPLGIVVLTAAIGFGLSVLWEIGEYLGNTYLDPEIYVGYVDTVGDVTVGGLGSALAGWGLAVWGRRAVRLAPAGAPVH